MKESSKRTIGIVIAILLIVIGSAAYPILYKETIRKHTSAYVAEQGYPTESIKNIEILHSYSAKLLGYNEWRISVEFEKRPNMFFWFTYKEGGILYQGVSSEPMMDKADVVKYSDQFKDGTLLD